MNKKRKNIKIYPLLTTILQGRNNSHTFIHSLKNTKTNMGVMKYLKEVADLTADPGDIEKN